MCSSNIGGDLYVLIICSADNTVDGEAVWGTENGKLPQSKLNLKIQK